MRKATVLSTTLLLALAGCGEERVATEAIPLDRLPPGSLELAKKELPGVTFDSARKAKYQGQDAIEIRGKDKQGKIREVEVDLNGNLLEVE
jgi:hypothetical protein